MTGTEKITSQNRINDVIEKPYLSIVICSRNDDHGGNMLRRMQVSIDGLLQQLEKYYIDSELILVDWNPPADKPQLRNTLNWPDKVRCCTIRVIVVPPSIHQRYEYSDIMPMNAVVAVNCGIRRARGQFILPGVIDLLYSDDLMAYIASKSLREDARYRADRCDVDRKAIQYDTLKEQLDYSKKNIIRINAQQPQKHRWLGRNLPDLHTNACGDFQLMSRHYWHVLRGYREADIIAAHVDGLLSYASYAAGLQEVILKDTMRIYHIDHADKFNERIKTTAGPPSEGWLSLPFLPAGFNRRIFKLYLMILTSMGYKRASVHGVPTLDHTNYQKMCRKIVAGKRPYIFNDENWGLGRESLEEFIINAADWDKDYGKN